ncbi:unnamed protein product [Calypogeia fissa]
MAGAHFRSLIRVYHNDNRVLKSLRKFDLSESTLEAISRGERSISTKFFSRREMKRLKRMGLRTESNVDLVVVFPWNATAFLTIVAKANDTQLRPQVLGIAVDRIRKTDPDAHQDDLRGELTVESNELELPLAEITIIDSSEEESD